MQNIGKKWTLPVGKIHNIKCKIIWTISIELTTGLKLLIASASVKNNYYTVR